jgi:hypothetical protein
MTVQEESIMLERIAIGLFFLWGLGIVGGVALGGLVHLLLVAAIVLAFVRIMQVRRITGTP